MLLVFVALVRWPTASSAAAQGAWHEHAQDRSAARRQRAPTGCRRRCSTRAAGPAGWSPACWCWWWPASGRWTCSGRSSSRSRRWRSMGRFVGELCAARHSARRSCASCCRRRLGDAGDVGAGHAAGGGGRLAAGAAGQQAARRRPRRAGAAPTRLLLNALRSIPELVWAALLLIAAGLGPFAGTLALAVHTTGVLGRLFAEGIENAGQGPASALRVAACGKAGCSCMRRCRRCCRSC